MAGGGFIKLRNGLREHPKMLIARAQDELAFGAYVGGLLYCNLNRTDGFIPGLQVAALTAPKRPGKVAEALVNAGLWHQVEEGFVVHDYLDHNSSREQIERSMKKDTERKESK